MVKLKNFIKIFSLALVLYFISIRLFRKLENRWFGVHNEKDNRPEIVRRQFWAAFVCCVIFALVVVLVQTIFFDFQFTNKYFLQIIGVTITLIATFGKANVQSYSGKTPIEFIDRGMFTISYFGATGILLFILIL